MPGISIPYTTPGFVGIAGEATEQLRGALERLASSNNGGIPLVVCDPPLQLTLGYLSTTVSHRTALAAEEVLASEAAAVLSAALCFHRIRSGQHRKSSHIWDPLEGLLAKIQRLLRRSGRLWVLMPWAGCLLPQWLGKEGIEEEMV